MSHHVSIDVASPETGVMLPNAVGLLSFYMFVWHNVVGCVAMQNDTQEQNQNDTHIYCKTNVNLYLVLVSWQRDMHPRYSPVTVTVTVTIFAVGIVRVDKRQSNGSYRERKLC